MLMSTSWLFESQRKAFEDPISKDRQHHGPESLRLHLLQDSQGEIGGQNKGSLVCPTKNEQNGLIGAHPGATHKEHVGLSSNDLLKNIQSMLGIHPPPSGWTPMNLRNRCTDRSGVPFRPEKGVLLQMWPRTRLRSCSLQ